MEFTRRQMIVGTTALALLPLGACSGASWPQIQGYVKTIRAFVDTIVPQVEVFAPAQKAILDEAMKSVDAAADVIATLSSPGSAKDKVTLLLRAANDVLKVAAAIPTPPMPAHAKLILGSVQILLVTIALFFGIDLTSPTSLAVHRLEAPPPEPLERAQSRYRAAANKPQLAAEADREIRGWVETQPRP